MRNCSRIPLWAEAGCIYYAVGNRVYRVSEHNGECVAKSIGEFAVPVVNAIFRDGMNKLRIATSDSDGMVLMNIETDTKEQEHRPWKISDVYEIKPVGMNNVLIYNNDMLEKCSYTGHRNNGNDVIGYKSMPCSLLGGRILIYSQKRTVIIQDARTNSTIGMISLDDRILRPIGDDAFPLVPMNEHQAVLLVGNEGSFRTVNLITVHEAAVRHGLRYQMVTGSIARLKAWLKNVVYSARHL